MDVRSDDAIAAFQRGDVDQARSLAQAQLATEPDSARLQHLMGLIECRCGRVAEGVEWLRRASEAEPDNIAFRVMLARALVDAGKADAALDVATPRSATAPAELALWHARAEAADCAERFDVAAEAWRVLALARQGDWRGWANLGEALGRLERWPDAAEALRRAWELNGVDRPLQQKYASALAWAGQYEESADQLRQMLDAGPEDVGIRLTLARLYADLGLNKERIEQLDKAAKYAVGDSSSADSNTDLIRIALPDHDPSEPVSDEGIRPSGNSLCCSSGRAESRHCATSGRRRKTGHPARAVCISARLRLPSKMAIQPKRSVCSSLRMSSPIPSAGTA